MPRRSKQKGDVDNFRRGGGKSVVSLLIPGIIGIKVKEKDPYGSLISKNGGS